MNALLCLPYFSSCAILTNKLRKLHTEKFKNLKYETKHHLLESFSSLISVLGLGNMSVEIIWNDLEEVLSFLYYSCFGLGDSLQRGFPGKSRMFISILSFTHWEQECPQCWQTCLHTLPNVPGHPSCPSPETAYLEVCSLSISFLVAGIMYLSLSQQK